MSEAWKSGQYSDRCVEKGSQGKGWGTLELGCGGPSQWYKMAADEGAEEGKIEHDVGFQLWETSPLILENSDLLCEVLDVRHLPDWAGWSCTLNVYNPLSFWLMVSKGDGAEKTDALQASSVSSLSNTQVGPRWASPIGSSVLGHGSLPYCPWSVSTQYSPCSSEACSNQSEIFFNARTCPFPQTLFLKLYCILGLEK